MELESSQEYKDAVEVLKKTEQDVIPRIENAEDRRELEELCRQVRQAMGSGDKKKMEEASAHAERSAAELRVFAVTPETTPSRKRSLVFRLRLSLPAPRIA